MVETLAVKRVLPQIQILAAVVVEVVTFHKVRVVQVVQDLQSSKYQQHKIILQYFLTRQHGTCLLV
jgi:hypothetical protein